MDLRLKEGGKCLLCRNLKSSHDGGDYNTSSCMDTLRKLVEFVEEYRGGLFEKEDFEVVIKVRAGEIAALGTPGHVLRTKS